MNTTPSLFQITDSSVPMESTDADLIEFSDYKNEAQLEHVMKLVLQDLSEPYSSKLLERWLLRTSDSSLSYILAETIVYTYRYFLHRYPELCILAVPRESGEPIGCVVGKVDYEEVVANGETKKVQIGYIGMLAVQASYRRRGIGKALVRRVLQRMKLMGCVSVTLETEVANVTAQHLYQGSFGFVREELLVRYYLNWGDAYRLRLWF